MEKKNSQIAGTLQVMLAGMLWGTTGTFVRFFTNIGLSTTQVSVFKIAFAAVILLLFSLIYDKSLLKVAPKDLWIFACAGIISLDFFTVCYFSTIASTSLSVAAVLLYSSPVIVLVLSAILFGDKITPVKVAACIIAFVGCFMCAGLIGSGTSISTRSLITGLLSALGYGLYSIFGQIGMNKGYKPLTVTTYTFLFAAIGCLVLVSPSEISEAMAQTTPIKFIGMAVLISVVVSLLPYIFFTRGLQLVSPSKASIIASIEPVTATVVGILVFKEFPDVFGYIGIALVLCAIVLLNIKIGRKADK